MNKFFSKIFGKSKKDLPKAIEEIHTASFSITTSNIEIKENEEQPHKQQEVVKAQQIKEDNKIGNDNKSQTNSSLNPNEKVGDIVVVNAETEPKIEGFYYNKYISQVQQLSLSNPILVERDKMKVNFDTEIMDYLVNDMTLIFREKQTTVDTNQVIKIILIYLHRLLF
jgi:hypothetical protein